MVTEPQRPVGKPIKDFQDLEVGQLEKQFVFSP